MWKLRRGDIVAVVLAGTVVVFLLFTYLRYPDWRPPTGFGPEWQCSARGAHDGPDFCVKKPAPKPADERAPD